MLRNTNNPKSIYKKKHEREKHQQTTKIREKISQHANSVKSIVMSLASLVINNMKHILEPLLGNPKTRVL